MNLSTLNWQHMTPLQPSHAAARSLTLSLKLPLATTQVNQQLTLSAHSLHVHLEATGKADLPKEVKDSGSVLSLKVCRKSKSAILIKDMCWEAWGNIGPIQPRGKTQRQD